MRAKALGLLSLAFTLTACKLPGVDGVNELNKTVNDLASLSVLVTDTVKGLQREVWVNIVGLDAVDETGATVSFYSNASGRVFNLASLQGAGELLHAQQVPAGTYNGFRLTVARDVTLVDGSGQTSTAQLPGSGATATVAIPGTLTVEPGKKTSFALDFDLSNFTLDGNVLRPAISLLGDTSPLLDRTIARIDGVVVAVDAVSGTFTIQTSDGTDIQVGLQASAALTNEATGAAGGTLDMIALNAQVSIYGSYDPAALSVQAVSVDVNATVASSGAGEQVVGRVVEVKGVVQSVADNALVVDAREASFIPAADTITVIDTANALYRRGDQTLLASGQTVEVKGTWDGNQLTATVIEIEGAHRGGQTDERGDVVQAVAEVKGQVVDVQGNQVTVVVAEAEQVSLDNTGTLTVDVSGAWFKQGSMDCLASGTAVEIKGTVAQTGAITPTVVEIKDPCTTAQAPGDTNADNGEQSQGGTEVENTTPSDLRSAQDDTGQVSESPGDSSGQDGAAHTEQVGAGDQQQQHGTSVL